MAAFASSSLTDRPAQQSSRRAAAREAFGAIAIEGGHLLPDALATFDAWIDGRLSDPVLVDRVDHLRTLASDADRAADARVAARYAILPSLPPALPVTFNALCSVHRDLFDWREQNAGTPRRTALAAADGMPRPTGLTSDAEPGRIPALADVAFRCIDGGRSLAGTSRTDFVGLAAEFAADLTRVAPFAYGNGITLRLLLTHLGEISGHRLAFRGATPMRVRDAFARALDGNYSSLIQLIDAALRPPSDNRGAVVVDVRGVLVTDASIRDFAAALARRHGVGSETLPIDRFANAVSRLSDAAVLTDTTQDLLSALGRAGVLAAHDVVMLQAAYLRQKG